MHTGTRPADGTPPNSSGMGIHNRTRHHPTGWCGPSCTGTRPLKRTGTRWVTWRRVHSHHPRGINPPHRWRMPTPVGIHPCTIGDSRTNRVHPVHRVGDNSAPGGLLPPTSQTASPHLAVSAPAHPGTPGQTGSTPYIADGITAPGGLHPAHLGTPGQTGSSPYIAWETTPLLAECSPVHHGKQHRTSRNLLPHHLGRGAPTYREPPSSQEHAPPAMELSTWGPPRGYTDTCSSFDSPPRA